MNFFESIILPNFLLFRFLLLLLILFVSRQLWTSSNLALSWFRVVKFKVSMHLKLIKLLESQLHEKVLKKHLKRVWQNMSNGRDCSKDWGHYLKWLVKRSSEFVVFLLLLFCFQFFFQIKNHFGMFKRFETLLIDYHGFFGCFKIGKLCTTGF